MPCPPTNSRDVPLAPSQTSRASANPHDTVVDLWPTQELRAKHDMILNQALELMTQQFELHLNSIMTEMRNNPRVTSMAELTAVPTTDNTPLLHEESHEKVEDAVNDSVSQDFEIHAKKTADVPLNPHGQPSATQATNDDKPGNTKKPEVTAPGKKNQEKKTNNAEVSVNEFFNSVHGRKPRDTRAHRMITHPIFDFSVALVIITNSAWAGYFINVKVADAFSKTSEAEKLTTVAMWLEICFYCFYVVEMVLKLSAFGHRYFTNKDATWNMFDMVLVLFSSYDIILYMVSSDSGGSSRVNFLKTLRLLKMVKMLRVVRVLKFFKELRLILTSIMNASRLFLWIILMLALILYMFSLVFLQGIADFLKDNNVDNWDLAEKTFVESNFGNVGRCMITLAKSITGGAPWGHAYESLKPIGGIYLAIFLFFIAFLSMAVLKLLTGIFVQHAKDVVGADREAKIREEIERKAQWEEEIKVVFKSMDSDSSGDVSWDEFAAKIECVVISGYFQSLGIDAADAKRLFFMLDKDGSQSVNLEEFIAGCMKLRGPARSSDVLCQTILLERLFDLLTFFMKHLDDRIPPPQSAKATEDLPLKEKVKQHTLDKRVTCCFANDALTK